MYVAEVNYVDKNGQTYEDSSEVIDIFAVVHLDARLIASKANLLFRNIQETTRHFSTGSQNKIHKDGISLTNDTKSTECAHPCII